MGINICIQTLDGKDHPNWDYLRYAGDRTFPDWIGNLERRYGDEDREYFRPVDFAAWRSALPADRDNFDRFPEMFDILERDTDYWIYLSY